MTNDDAQPCDLASSISCTTQEIRSVADLLGSAPNCCALTTSETIARWDILFAISLSKPFPRHESRAMGLHPFIDDGSRPDFGMKTTSASLKQEG